MGWQHLTLCRQIPPMWVRGVTPAPVILSFMRSPQATLGVPAHLWGASARTVVVFGGTFDPPHRAHIDLPQRVAASVGADWLVYIPAAQSPHKQHRPGASGHHRLGMMRAAIARSPRCSASDIELRRPGGQASFTVDTLRELRAILPETVTLRLLIGADQGLALHRWHEPQAIVDLAEPVVMHRPSCGATSKELAHQLANLPAPAGASVAKWKSRIVDVPQVEASSTRVRALLRHSSDPQARAELRRLVPGQVLHYIERHGLYRHVPGL